MLLYLLTAHLFWQGEIAACSWTTYSTCSGVICTGSLLCCVKGTQPPKSKANVPSTSADRSQHCPPYLYGAAVTLIHLDDCCSYLLYVVLGTNHTSLQLLLVAYPLSAYCNQHITSSGAYAEYIQQLCNHPSTCSTQSPASTHCGVPDLCCPFAPRSLPYSSVCLVLPLGDNNSWWYT